MSDPADTRSFLRLVILCAILANGGAALVVQGERDLRPFRVGVVLDRDRLTLTDELKTYGQAVAALRSHIRGEGRP